MTVLDIQSRDLADEVFVGWLNRFAVALASDDPTCLSGCFAPEGYWKDILAFTWGYRTVAGAADIASALLHTSRAVGPRAFRASPDRTPPRVMKRGGRRVVEAFFDFDTNVGRGTGFVRLVPDDDDPAASTAWIALTTLQELRGFEEPVGARRPTGIEYSHSFAGDNWLDKRRKEQAFADREPEVLVVGGGQAGLTLGARLRHLGADTLIVEKLPRVGDNWRNRYHSLTLHNEVWANSLPYMPFPPSWPTYLPKDKLAGWLEAYAEAMELNIWTSTEFVGATYDEAAAMWTVRIRTADGAERTLRPRHLVLAIGGASGIPNIPALPGLGDFAGDVMHSHRFMTGADYAGRRAIVVGTGVSGHDVAQDLYSNGAASVTMVQRSPTTVVSLVPSGTMVYALYSEGPPVEDIDLITAAVPYPVLRDTYQWLNTKICELDRELLDGLHAVGFQTDCGPDNTGFHMKFLRHGGGYYINVGCAELISEGKIGLVQASDIDTFTADGLRLSDGRTIDADLVVLATGYLNLQEGIRRLLGDAVADRVGPVWGFDENHIMRNMWQRTAQPGFWIMGGSLVDCRLYSKFLALQIKADLEGLSADQ